jgi:hypothetical protein
MDTIEMNYSLNYSVSSMLFAGLLPAGCLPKLQGHAPFSFASPKKV